MPSAGYQASGSSLVSSAVPEYLAAFLMPAARVFRSDPATPRSTIGESLGKSLRAVAKHGFAVRHEDALDGQLEERPEA
jgi:hypothetical protein